MLKKEHIIVTCNRASSDKPSLINKEIYKWGIWKIFSVEKSILCILQHNCILNAYYVFFYG